MKQGRIVPLLLSLICLALPAHPADKDRSGATIMLQSTVYKVGDRWHCPLCRQEVPNADRTGWDLKRTLSEWHDVLIDEEYFHTKIQSITDEELVRSLHIPPLDASLRAAVSARDSGRVSLLLHEYFKGRPDNNRLSTYDAQNKKYFITIDEFLREVRNDTARAREIIRSAQEVFTPEKGFTLYGVHWGNRIDFNHTYPHASKYGVHYLSFIDGQIAHYLLTGDPAIARAFGTLFDQWYDQLDNVKLEQVIHQKTAYDVVWYELGLANRNQRLIDAQRVFVRHLTPETNKRLLKIILGSTRWLDQCLEKTPFHPYNWQTHSAMTLSYAALVFPEFTESQAWLQRGKASMVLHLENDILDDGGYVERTPSYAEYMFSVFYRYMMMLQHFANDSSLRERYMPRLEKFIEFFVLANAPVGVNTPFNDAARNKSLVRVFAEMGEFFRRGDFPGSVRYEFTPEALAALSVPAAEPALRSVDFPDSRFVVMRDSWNPRSYFLILNYGEYANHCHYDHLDFEIYANGIPIALDAGIGKLGYLDSLHVSWYKHPLSHNMITINQAVPEKMDMPGYDKVWDPQRQTEVFAATHNGYLRYQQATHRRHVIFAKRTYWLIIDEVTTAGKSQEMDFNFHTPCSMTPIPNGFLSSGEVGFLITQDRRDASAISTMKLQGGANLAGLNNEPSHRDIDWLVFRKELRGDRRSDRMATLVYPFAARADILPAEVFVERVDLLDEAATGYRVHTRDREDLIIISDGAYRKFTERIEGDFTYARISAVAGNVDYAGFTNVSRFLVEGIPALTLPTRRSYEYQK